ncbi:MAG: NAD(P)-dependent oxidoreductase [Nanoarchaeota archaeon]|nr:NAD(P)-dependent oxidoreductase [Nanoarchaeota archaeon]
MKVLVTGGAGFLGTELVIRLIKNKSEVIAFDRIPKDNVRLPKQCIYVEGDITEFQRYEKIVGRIDCVYHCAAALPISKSETSFRDTNVFGTEKVLETSLRNKVRKVIFISTSAVYTPNKALLPITEETELSPCGRYGKSKYDAEQIVQRYKKKGLDCSIIRPRTILGKGRLGIFQILFEWIGEDKNVYLIGDGNNLFQFIGLGDLVEGIILAGTKPCKNQDFNMGAERYGTVREDLGWLIKKVKSMSRIVGVNAIAARTVLMALDKLNLSPLVDWHYMTPNVPFYFDTKKSRDILGWKPKEANRDLLLETYNWYNKMDKSSLHYGKTHSSIQKQGILKLVKMFS